MSVKIGTALAFAGVRFGFGIAERLCPALGARWAERLWFTAPRPRRRPIEPPGRRVEVTVSGRRIMGESWGEGPTVVLVHGWGGHRAQLAAFVEPLVDSGHHVVAIDAPGHGESAPGVSEGRQATILEFADALTAVCTAEGPAHAVIAHSIGCMASAIAVRNGLPCERLVLLAPMSEVTSYTRQFAARLGFGERVRTRLTRRIEDRVGKPLSYFDIPAMGVEPGIPSLLLVHDREDRETPWAGSHDIVRAWPGARLLTTIGLGHRGILRNPGVIREVVSFVAAQPASSPAPAAQSAPGCHAQ
jgi:pimeloyl-ACP methyl ester carboxylesterase